MTTEQNKATASRMSLEVLNGHNPALIDEIFAPDYVEHDIFPDEVPHGREGLKILAGIVLDAFPDVKYDVEQSVAEGDWVAQRLTASGTHKGEFMGVAPTNKQVCWGEMHFSRFENGKIAEHWSETTTLDILQQLGVLPPPGKAA